MKTELSFAPFAEMKTELLAVLAVDTQTSKDSDAKPVPELLTADKAILAAAEAVLASGEFKAAAHETLLLHAPAGLAAKRLLLVGLGKQAKATANSVREAAGAAVRFAKPRGIRELAFALPLAEQIPAASATRAAVEGAFVGDFDGDTYRSDRQDRSIQSFTLATPAEAEKTALEAAFAEGVILGESQNFTRSLVNEPGNKLTPAILSQRAVQMADTVGLDCRTFSTEKIQELKMGAFWSVAQGSAEPPALIVLRYEPKGVTTGPVLGLVGKGITFDSGGISLKPSKDMDEMKTDMAGAATMLGAMRAIALLKPKVRVLAVLCATENMPDGKAQKPGDVQTAMPSAPDKPGKTIEIISTDAEGRLVLADGLTYARQLGATHLIDADWRLCRRAGNGHRRRILERRGHLREVPQGAGRLRRKVLAAALGRRVCRADQERHRRHQEHRRPLGRRNYRGRVPQSLCRGHALDSPRHCRPGLAARGQALYRQRRQRHWRALDSGVGAKLQQLTANS
jgi:leucyl aminopeptidase